MLNRIIECLVSGSILSDVFLPGESISCWAWDEVIMRHMDVSNSVFSFINKGYVNIENGYYVWTFIHSKYNKTILFAIFFICKINSGVGARERSGIPFVV